MISFKRVTALVLAVLTLVAFSAVNVYAQEESAPAENSLVVNLSSNVGAPASSSFDLNSISAVKVTFSLRSANLVANAQGYISYDDTVLHLDSIALSDKFSNAFYNTNISNKATFNTTDVEKLADFTKEDKFITAIFTILDMGTTEVSLNIEQLNGIKDEAPDAIITDSAALDASLVECFAKVGQYPEPVIPVVALNAKSKTLKAGSTFTIKVLNTTAKASFSSDRKTIAAVDSKTGKVTALKKGSATITVKAAGSKYTCKITVSNNPTAKIKNKSISSKYYTLKKKGTITVKLTGKASAINNSYSSTKSKIAKVVSSKKNTSVKIKAYKKGKATITIKVNKVKSFKIKIKVK